MLFQDEGRAPCSDAHALLAAKTGTRLFVATHPCHPPVPYAHSCLLAVQQAMVDFAFLLASIE